MKNEIKKQEKTEYEKISEYYSKISKYRINHYKDFFHKGQYCDVYNDNEWLVGYIVDKNDSYLTVIDINKYYLYNDDTKYQMVYSDKISYFRKYTHPSLTNVIKERSNKNELAKRVKNLQQNEFINMFKENNKPLSDEQTFKIYSFLRSSIYNGFDLSICISKDKNSGVDEGFKIILIILEYLAEFFKFINNNFEDFINYKNELCLSELADLVLIEKKYAIFSFWEDANYLMSKIFLNNENYIEWFFDSEKVLQKIMPSSPSFKKITSQKQILYPLYSDQIQTLKSIEYNYKSFNGQILTLKRMCNQTNYSENKNIIIKNTKIPAYIIAYFIDYFFALGGYHALFSLSKNFDNLNICINALENICFAVDFTDNFKGMFEEEKNALNSFLVKFMEELDENNCNKYNKNLVIKLLKKGCCLNPKIQKKRNLYFEELYLKYILKLFLLNKKDNKKIELINDLINMLNSIEYNELSNSSNIDIKIEKYNKRDKNILEMNYMTFCINLKNSQIIQNIFENKNISVDYIELILPLLIIMYKNFFGYENYEKFNKEISDIKKLIFERILTKIKIYEQTNLNNLIKILKILCDFCEVFTEEDKYYIFSELKSNYYNAKYNQNASFKPFFNFIINYTCIAVKKLNIQNKEIKQEKIDTNNFDEKKLYGLELIYESILEEQYDFNKKNENIQNAIVNTIKIISSCHDQKLVLDVILNKISNAIKNQSNVIQHLLLLQKLVNCYNSNNNVNNIKILEENCKNINLFILLNSELKQFLKNVNKNNPNNINNNNIKIRVETIFSLMPSYTRNNFDFKNVKDFIQTMTQYSEYSRDICFECLVNSINSFSKDFILFINSDIISKKEIFDIKDFKAYQIYKKIMIKINMINNNHFLFYNKDIILQINEKSEIDNEIKGLDTLWNLLLNDDQNIQSNIIDDITEIICDIFFGVRVKTEKNIIEAHKSFCEDFINNVSQKLNSVLISKKAKKNIKAIKAIILLIKKIIYKSKNNHGEIIKNIKDIIIMQNENNEKAIKSQDNAVEFTFFGAKSFLDSLYFCDLKLRKDECFHKLRYTLSSLYKIPVNQIYISVYMNNLGKSELNQKNLEKIMKTPPLKQFNLLNDFDNIYQQLKGSLDFSQSKKKSSLLIHVNSVKKIWKEIYNVNPIKIIFEKSKLPLMFLSLLKGDEESYTYDVLNLIKDNINIFNKAIVAELEKDIKNIKSPGSLFDKENATLYYINYIISNLYEVVTKNYNDFIRSNLLNTYIFKLSVINDKEYSITEEEKFPRLNDLYEKYRLCNNLLRIYKVLCDNEKEESLFSMVVFKILNIYYYIINDSININLTKCLYSKMVGTNDIKILYDEILNNINDIIINNERIILLIIKSLINNDKNNKNIYLNKIRNIFMFISFDAIIKNKYSFINKKIKFLLFMIINKYCTDDSFNNFLYEFYLTENAFNKLINIFKQIYQEQNGNINNKKYEKNTKIFFDISSQILLLIYRFIKNKLNLEEYINKILTPKIFNYTQFIKQNFPEFSILPQLVIGGACKLYNAILLMSENININIDKKKYSEFLFTNIIMPNIKENILTPQNITNFDKNKDNDIIYFSSNFCIKEAANLFISFIFKHSKNQLNNNNNINIEYLKALNKYHNLVYWKGNLLSDWKLYYKTNENMTGFIGLKNLGSTCYINTILQIFYNIPLLRESLLSCDTSFNEGKNCLYQLKKVFYSLRYLLTNFYTPTSFIENFDNEKLDPKIQMDIFEFLCNFLDKIEKKLKNTVNENIIKYFFLGIQNDILAFDNPCQHHRINQSNFYTIQLQVQNKYNLYQSLDSFIEGERMEGDNCVFCEKCNKKIPAVKSQNFQILPRILTFVLKRFEFNYNTMQKFKINDYYEFPLELNMNKYVQKDNNVIGSNNYLYKLKSIVIHSGTCESGHYYCYILNEKNGEWYEFNDIKVTKFNINYLDKEAFGKNEIIFDEIGQKIEKENNRNAYMLFYEKVDFYNGLNFDNIKAINDILKTIKANNQKDNNDEDEFNLLNDDLDEKKGKIKTEYVNEIVATKIKKEELNDIINPMNKEMYNYFLYKRLFSGEYHHFVLSLFINILNTYKISVNNKLSFNNELCLNNINYIINKDIKHFLFDRKSIEISNINNYLSRNKIKLINKNENIIKTQIDNPEDQEKILEIFKHLIIYFFNVMIRSREKDYLGGTVDLIKYFINNYIYCADYLIEEFTNHNVLTEYMINCPLYETKKLIVGILYCAMINCITTYENKMKEIEKIENKKNKNKKPKKEEKNKSKTQENKNKNDTNQFEQPMDDEEFARRLQEEEDRKYSQQNWQNENDSEIQNKYYNNLEENSNPLDRKYIPVNIVKFIYNVLYLINLIKFQNMNESRFLYLILYRFSTISKKCKKFLLNKALVFEFLSILLFDDIKQENHNDTIIISTINKGCFKPSHSILFTNNKDISAIYDKGGAFHYENYITELYFYLLSHNQKEKAKRPYYEGSFNFDNRNFIKALFFRINTKLDADVFSYLIIEKCKNIKTYKKRIENILENIGNILSKADYNENINYDINSNKDVYNHNVYNSNSRNSNNIDYRNETPKINPKYLLLILRKFILTSSENKKIDEFRITQAISKIFSIFDDNQKYYNYCILLIDFITELFYNNITVLHPFINQFRPNIKSMIGWIRLNPISPELYPIDGLSMYKSDNVVYKNVTMEEKSSFNDKNMKQAEIRTNKLFKILDYKNNYNSKINNFEYDYSFEAPFDFTDFKFRKGDIIYYNKKKAIIKESLDELICIKIIDNDNNKNKDLDEDGYTIDDIEKIKFWVAKDDKNISVYNLE